MKSTFARLSTERREEALQRLARFEHWINTTLGLSDIAESADATIAIAQHYGMATTFVDFTRSPSIAAFFACDGATADQAAEDACIIYVDVDDFIEFWQTMPSRYRKPEFLELDVPNLWRLEAQAGSFVFCPHDDMELIYDFDRIIFPASSTFSSIAREEVYPDRKSHLEILLDQFFMNENMIQFESAYQPPVGTSSLYIENHEQGCDPDVFPNGMPDHDSWSSEHLHPWLELPAERLGDARTSERIELWIDPRWELEMTIAAVAADVRSCLFERSGIRNKLIDWHVSSSTSALPANFSERLSPRLGRLWDGLRKLPHSDDDLAFALGVCVGLAISLRGDFRNPDGQHWRDGASACIATPLELEFGTNDGSYSRGFAAASSINDAVREDLLSYVALGWKSQLVNNPFGVLQTAWTPQKTFDFFRLNRVIATQVAPYQVLARSEAIFYTAARLSVLGLP